MTILHIHINGDGTLTAIEREFGWEAKYIETFKTWADLFNALSMWMGIDGAYYMTEVHTPERGDYLEEFEES
jgi:hypothetical protein